MRIKVSIFFHQQVKGWNMNQNLKRDVEQHLFLKVFDTVLQHEH